MAIFSDVLGGYTSEDLLPGIQWQESRGNPDPHLLGPMTKHGQAIGAFQVLPSTGAYYGYSREDLFDPKKNRDAAKQYLDDLLRHYGGNGFFALAAYNAGQTNIDRGIFPPETQNYVSDIMGYNRGYTKGHTYATPKRPTPQGNPELAVAHQKIDSSLDPNTLVKTLFSALTTSSMTPDELRPGEQDITALPQRKGLFGRML